MMTFKVLNHGSDMVLLSLFSVFSFGYFCVASSGGDVKAPPSEGTPPWQYHALFKCLPTLVLACGVRRGAASLAFLLSSLGDFFLVVNDALKDEKSFLLGLASFLLAQWLFVYCFSTQSVGGEKDKSTKLGLALRGLCYVYAGFLYAILWDSIGGSDLAGPVLFYCFSIATMAASAVSYYLTDEGKFGALGLLGALAFVISDSYLALNMFYKPMPFSKEIILLTYFFAQISLAVVFHQPKGEVK